ncbi:MAG: bile acid:sodium symporter [Planctomycetes bacterium]|nr:bile acid:sodium symporter [Planctomycetota bacterium]
MLNFCKKQALILTIILSLSLAILLPGPGKAIYPSGVTNLILALIFLCQGLGVKTEDLDLKPSTFLILLWGAFISLIIYPFFSFLFIQLGTWPQDTQVGFFLMCSMAPTLVSGTLMAQRAGGNRLFALILTLGINCIGILVIPFVLNILLSTSIEFDRLALLSKLFFYVFCPACAGVFIRKLFSQTLSNYSLLIKNLPILFLGLILYISCSSQSTHLHNTSLLSVAVFIPLCLGIHVFFLIGIYFSSKSLFKFGESISRTLAILCSQKTLPIAMAVWSISLIESYPLAILPPIIFHFTQLIFDGMAVEYWRAKSSNN